jgi:uncharacterized repeat protein (TIGR01451 family)
MKKFQFNKVLIIVSAVAFMLGLTGPIIAFAASTTTVDLGTVDDFAVLGGSTVTNTGYSVVTGNLGLNPGTSVTGFPPGTVSGTIYTAGAAAGAQTALVAAYDDAAGRASTSTISALGGGQTLTPGVYKSGTSIDLTGTLTLDGGDDQDAVFIFQAGSTLTTASGSSVILTHGARACNVFWQVGSSATLGTNSIFQGNILALASITLNTGAWVAGRVLARNGAVTLDTNTVTEAKCGVEDIPLPSTPTCILAAVPATVQAGSPSVLSWTSTGASAFSIDGAVEPIGSGSITVTPIVTTTYTGTATGAGGSAQCSTDVAVTAASVAGGGSYNPPVPPLIDVVKVPSPLALPNGSGSVVYTYTVRNIGTVPMANITMSDDSCKPITFVSGDTNADAKLDVNETWVYSCSMTLLATRTNTVIATGWANGLSATDIASATVVVGAPVVPPLIHVTKVPNPLTLPAGGGMVTYTEKITNPGLVALSNVRLTDDKCAPMKYISGDINGDSKLDTTEVWTYTCQANLTGTTMNTAIAEGSANGLTIKDFAIATVVAADTVIPTLPNTGFSPERKNVPWNIFIPSGILAISILFYAVRKKTV